MDALDARPARGQEQSLVDRPPVRRLFELRDPADRDSFAPWSLRFAAPLAEAVREGLAARLRAALPAQGAALEYHLRGQPMAGRTGNPSARARLIPLPSLDDKHRDGAIRHVLLDVPPVCPLQVDDLTWGLTELVLDAGGTGPAAVLVPADNPGVLRRYGLAGTARRWATVTPIALPQGGERRTEGGREVEVGRGHTLRQALRHAGLLAELVEAALQRDPVLAGCLRAEEHAAGTRFASDRLWHARLAFAEPLAGPLLLGDGRFLGLGLLAPEEVASDEPWAFRVVDGLLSEPDPVGLSEALRRAVMACYRDEGRDDALPAWLSGHEADGGPLRQGAHLACAWDAPRARLLVLPPSAALETWERARLGRALDRLSEVRAGRAGLLRLARLGPPADDDPLFRPSTCWESATPYSVNRHMDRGSPQGALAADLVEELRRRGLPAAEVQVRRVWTTPRGLMGEVALRFERPAAGPLLLGRLRHKGGGLFAAVDGPA